MFLCGAAIPGGARRHEWRRHTTDSSPENLPHPRMIQIDLVQVSRPSHADESLAAQRPQRLVGLDQLERLLDLGLGNRAVGVEEQREDPLRRRGQPLEANAHGAPVVGFGRGALTETMTPSTAEFFARQEVDDVARAIKAALSRTWDNVAVRANAERFNPGRFREEIRRAMTASLSAATR